MSFSWTAALLPSGLAWLPACFPASQPSFTVAAVYFSIAVCELTVILLCEIFPSPQNKEEINKTITMLGIKTKCL